MNDDEKLKRIEEMIASYQAAWLDLIRIGVVPIESEDQDLGGMKETIDGLGEREVKDLLAVTVAELAHYYVEQRKSAELN